MQTNAHRPRSANDNAGSSVIRAGTRFRSARVRAAFFNALWRFTEYQDYSRRRNRQQRVLLVILCRNARNDIATLLVRSADRFAFSIFLTRSRTA